MYVDDFLPDPEAVRRAALGAEFIDWAAPDGEIYKRICITEVPGLRDRLEEVMGPVDLLGMGYRLNYAGELPNAAIHSDIGWGTHALVLYLNHEGPGGTAFWQHRATGAKRLNPGEVKLYERIRHDWNDETAWKLVDLIPLKFNRAAIYEGALFHSRFPLRAFGATPEEGRLIAIAFFSPRTGQHDRSQGHR
jgi:hypothetical protein